MEGDAASDSVQVVRAVFLKWADGTDRNDLQSDFCAFLQRNYVCCRLTGGASSSGDNADGLVEWETCSKDSFAADPVCHTWMKRRWENIILHHSCYRWASHTPGLGVVLNWSLIKYPYNSLIISMPLGFCFFILPNPSYFIYFLLVQSQLLFIICSRSLHHLNDMSNARLQEKRGAKTSGSCCSPPRLQNSAIPWFGGSAYNNCLPALACDSWFLLHNHNKEHPHRAISGFSNGSSEQFLYFSWIIIFLTPPTSKPKPTSWHRLNCSVLYFQGLFKFILERNYLA